MDVSWLLLTFGEKGNAQILHDLFLTIGYYNKGYNNIDYLLNL